MRRQEQEGMERPMQPFHCRRCTVMFRDATDPLATENLADELMPSLLTQTHLRPVQRLSFCYLCGRPFAPTDKIDHDHVPPKSCIAERDRNFPVKLPTHVDCHGGYKRIDELIGQLVSFKHGRVPTLSSLRLKFREVKWGEAGKGLTAIDNLNIHDAIYRWVRAFHAALYNEYLPKETRFGLETPFVRAEMAGEEHHPEPLRPQHALFVREIKRNRLANNLDCIHCNNGALRYECVWIQMDGGQWGCVFALDLYDWKDLGAIDHLPSRGCVGFYMRPKAAPPPTGTRSTHLIIDFEDANPNDPFG